MRCAAFSPDGCQILTASWDGTAKLWDAVQGNLLSTFAGHMGRLYFADFLPDGRMVTGGQDNTARIWDRETGDLLCVFRAHTATVGSVAFSPEGKYVLTGNWDGKARLWPFA